MADVAFGIEAAARAHQLAFVGLVTERYHLAWPPQCAGAHRR